MKIKKEEKHLRQLAKLFKSSRDSVIHLIVVKKTKSYALIQGDRESLIEGLTELFIERPEAYYLIKEAVDNMKNEDDEDT